MHEPLRPRASGDQHDAAPHSRAALHTGATPAGRRTAMDFSDGKSAYEILGLDQGTKATPDEIKKVGRGSGANPAAAPRHAAHLEPAPARGRR